MVMHSYAIPIACCKLRRFAILASISNYYTKNYGVGRRGYSNSKNNI